MKRDKEMYFLFLLMFISFCFLVFSLYMVNELSNYEPEPAKKELFKRKIYPKHRKGRDINQLRDTLNA